MKFFLVVVVAGGYVDEGEHFHAFRALSCAVSVESAAVRASPDHPHIHRQFCERQERLPEDTQAYAWSRVFNRIKKTIHRLWRGGVLVLWFDQILLAKLLKEISVARSFEGTLSCETLPSLRLPSLKLSTGHKGLKVIQINSIIQRF